MIDIACRITFNSDFYFGMGTRNENDIELTQQLSNEGIIIPATAIIGSWKKRFIEYLTNVPKELQNNISNSLKLNINTSNEHQSFKNYFIKLFGSKNVLKQFILTDAYLIKHDFETITRVRSGNKINRETGSAESGKLFFKQTGGRSTHYKFQLSIPYEKSSIFIIPIYVLLSINYLGSRINRGYGNCQISLFNDKLHNDLILSYESIIQGAYDKRWTKNFSTAISETTNNDLSKMIQLSLVEDTLGVKIKLLERTILGSNESNERNFSSDDFVSGNKFLGALIGSLYRTNRDVEWNFFTNGEIKVSPLYPIDQNIYYFPAPKSFLQCKTYSLGQYSLNGDSSLHHKIIDSHLEGDVTQCVDIIKEDQKCEGKIKPIKDFIAFLELKDGDKKSFIYKTKKKIAFHNSLKLNAQPAQPELFDYEYVEPEQEFCGVLTFKDSKKTEKFFQLFALTNISDSIDIELGKSFSRGFGKAKVNFFKLDGYFKDLWLCKTANFGNTLSIYCLSPLILIDTFQRNITSFGKDSVDKLEKFFGIPSQKIDPETIKSFIEIEEYSGYNSFTGIPRLHDYGIKEGSLIYLSLKEDLTVDEINKIHELQVKGIGLRCNEGFGRIYYNHPLLSSIPQTVFMTSNAYQIKNDELSDFSTILDKKWKEYDINKAFNDKFVDQFIKTFISRLSSNLFGTYKESEAYISNFIEEKSLKIENYSYKRPDYSMNSFIEYYKNIWIIFSSKYNGVDNFMSFSIFKKEFLEYIISKVNQYDMRGDT